MGVAPAKYHNRPRMARDTRWWRVLSNRLRELWLIGGPANQTAAPAAAAGTDRTASIAPAQDDERSANR